VKGVAMATPFFIAGMSYTSIAGFYLRIQNGAFQGNQITNHGGGNRKPVQKIMLSINA
jgi:hypothetical protein